MMKIFIFGGLLLNVHAVLSMNHSQVFQTPLSYQFHQQQFQGNQHLLQLQQQQFQLKQNKQKYINIALQNSTMWLRWLRANTMDQHAQLQKIVEDKKSFFKKEQYCLWQYQKNILLQEISNLEFQLYVLKKSIEQKDGNVVDSMLLVLQETDLPKDQKNDCFSQIMQVCQKDRLPDPLMIAIRGCVKCENNKSSM